MVRSDLIKAILQHHPTLSARDAEKIVTVFFDEIVRSLASGGRVEIRGFGTFSTRPRNARTGRNPLTGTKVEVFDKRVPYFKPGRRIRELILNMAGTGSATSNAATDD